jgi:NADH:ubiquinone oxidoreductase subunit E
MKKELTADDIATVLQEYGKKRDNLIPILQELQNLQGYLSEIIIAMAAEHLEISKNDVYGVASFYAQFRFAKPGEHIVKVCLGTACHVRGGEQIKNEISRHLGILPGQTTSDYKFSLERVACFGSCALSPVVVIDDAVHARMTPQKAVALLNSLEMQER